MGERIKKIRVNQMKEETKHFLRKGITTGHPKTAPVALALFLFWFIYLVVKVPEIVFESYPIVASVKKSRNAFLLITLYRSGSTLTGEMFNRNADFLYYFEPLGKIFNKVNGHEIKVDGHVTGKFDNL